MKKIKFMRIIAIMLLLNIFILSAVPAQASTQTILTYTDYAKTPSKYVEVRATLTVQDSYHYIIDIDNVNLASTMSPVDGSTVTLSQPVNYGSYALVSVTYLLNGVQMQEDCIFYPL